MNTNFDASIMADFIVESTEHLTAAEEDLLYIEKNQQADLGEIIHRIFRAVHTVKGSSGFFGLTAIGSVSHAMETLLALVREGERTLTSHMVDALLNGVGVLQNLISDINNSNNVDITEIEQTILAFVSGISVEKPKQVELRTNTDSVTHFTIPKAVVAQFEPGSYLYEITMNLTDIESNGSLVGFVLNLQQTGDIIDGMVEVSGVSVFDDTDDMALIQSRFLYSTVLEVDFLEMLFPVPPVSILQLSIADVVENEDTQELPQKSISPAELPVTVLESKEIAVKDTHSIESQNSSKPIAQTAKDSKEQVSDTLRVRLDILDKLMMLAGELVLVRNQQLINSTDVSDAHTRSITQRLDIVTSELQETIMRTRMQPVGTVFSKFTRIVRDIGRQLNKEIELVVSGQEVELDKNIIEGISDPLTHIIRNSCDHGLETPADRRLSGKSETGSIRLDAFHEGGHIHIVITDDGRGISRQGITKKVLEKGLRTEEELRSMSDKEIVKLIFLPGFSTAEQVTSISGRGVGMDVVKTSIERLGGIIDISSEEGKGTSMTLRLPLTLAIIPSLVVKSCNQLFAIPQINLEELVCLYDEQIHQKIQCVGNREVYHLRDTLLPVVHLNEIFMHSKPWAEDEKSAMAEKHRKDRELQYKELCNGLKNEISMTFAVVRAGNIRYCLVIDSVMATEEIVVKPIHKILKKLQIYSGATVLGDGKVSLILDTLGIARHANLRLDTADSNSNDSISPSVNADNEKRELLLFKSGIDEQLAFNISDVKRIEPISISSFERVGHTEFITLADGTIPVIRLETFIDVSSCLLKENMYLIIPKIGTIGILASELIDVGVYSIPQMKQKQNESIIVGSIVLEEHLSQLLCMKTLLRRVESMEVNHG